ncbi:MAG: maleylpyruvate isomerase family mycothiol-dependent enzyme [Dehalococcoidia bacterium]|nr:maleylpyruvate isomerase family mycothiol-dependent enzyme [Dehalococcoidia bacterium]
MDTPESRVKLLESEVEAVKSYLSGLTSDDLQKPSACVDWSVADVVGHLAGQDHALRVRRGLQGDYSAPEGSQPVADHDEDRFAKNIFDRAVATREQFGEGLVAYLNQRLDETIEVFKSVELEDWNNLCYWPPGPEPVNILLNQRLAELTMHTWDIRSVLETEYHLSDDAVRVLIEGVDRAARRAFRPDPSLTIPISHRFVIDRPVAGIWDIVISIDGAKIGPAGREEPDVTFECDGETYVLIMFGRLKVPDALADGRLTFDGNPELTIGFGRRFVGG